MNILDAFFTVAPPFVVIVLVVASAGAAYAKKRGIYEGAEGERQRDAVNQRYRTNAGAGVIGVIFVLLWGLTVAALVQQWGAIPFTFVISAILIVPFLTVCTAVIALYMLVVHGVAKFKDE